MRKEGKVNGRSDCPAEGSQDELLRAQAQAVELNHGPFIPCLLASTDGIRACKQPLPYARDVSGKKGMGVEGWS